jgi:predicted DNA-binding WGR domain protein
MRIFLQSQAAPNEPPKYYQLQLEQDLFGGWSLVREWGQQGTRASVKREQYLELATAQLAMEKARDAQVKKGFRVMFAQGVEAPVGLRIGSDD